MIRKINKKIKPIKLSINESNYRELTYNKLNEETKDAIEEAHKIVHDPKVRLYSNLEEFWEDVWTDA